MELTDVKVCSKSVFNDLQAEYRMQTFLNAETIKIKTKADAETERIASELKVLKNQEENQT